MPSLESLLIAVALLLLAGCAGGEEEPVDGVPTMPDLERLPPAAIEDYGESGVFEELTFDGEEVLVARVWTDELQQSPFTRRPCAYWWREVGYFDGEVIHHIETVISKNELWVEVDGKLIEVGQAKRGMRPQYVETFAAGEEPEHMAHVDWAYWEFPEATYEEWTLEQGGLYRIRVEVFGSAIEAPEEEGGVIYETYYHYTFLGPAE